MFGYATDETEECMPLTVVLAHKLNQKIAELRRSGELWWARPDTKTQVNIRNAKPPVYRFVEPSRGPIESNLHECTQCYVAFFLLSFSLSLSLSFFIFPTLNTYNVTTMYCMYRYSLARSLVDKCEFLTVAQGVSGFFSLYQPLL